MKVWPKIKPRYGTTSRETTLGVIATKHGGLTYPNLITVLSDQRQESLHVPADCMSTADCMSPADWPVAEDNIRRQQTADIDTVTLAKSNAIGLTTNFYLVPYFQCYLVIFYSTDFLSHLERWFTFSSFKINTILTFTFRKMTNTNNI